MVRQDQAGEVGSLGQQAQSALGGSGAEERELAEIYDEMGLSDGALLSALMQFGSGTGSVTRRRSVIVVGDHGRLCLIPSCSRLCSRIWPGSLLIKSRSWTARS